jgi:hypothetical protein
MAVSTAIGSSVDRYSGRGLTDREMRVDVSVKGEGKPARVEFKGKSIRLFCDDGTRFRQTAPIASGRVYDRNFQLEEDRINAQTGSELYYYTRGTLNRAATQIHGFIVMVYDFGSGSDAPKCSTLGRATWRAQRR